MLVDFDADIKPMSKVETTESWESRIYSDTTFNNKWQDLTQLRFGAEYTYNADFAKIALRAGGMTLPLVAKALNSLDSAGTRVEGNQVSPFIITFGTGVKFEKAWIDLAYQFGSNSYNTNIIYRSPLAFKIEQKVQPLLDFGRYVFLG